MAGAARAVGSAEAPARGGRPRRTAAARRAQHERANARAVQLLLRSFASLREHRGGEPSTLGNALAAAFGRRSSWALASEEAEAPPLDSALAEVPEALPPGGAPGLPKPVKQEQELEVINAEAFEELEVVDCPLDDAQRAAQRATKAAKEFTARVRETSSKLKAHLGHDIFGDLYWQADELLQEVTIAGHSSLAHKFKASLLSYRRVDDQMRADAMAAFPGD